MERFIVSTETCADIFRSEMDERKISRIAMNFIVNNEIIEAVYDKPEEYYDFFKKIKEGMLPTTSQINQFEFTAYFKKLLTEKQKDIIHFSLSSGLSGTADCAKAAASELNAEDKYAGKVFVVDTLAATQGMAKLIELAADMRDRGETAEDVFMFMEHKKNYLHHWVIVTDLHHLKRGGRVSGAAAAIGSILNIRPILVINNVGKLAVVNKVTGANKSINAVIKAAYKYGENLDKQLVYMAQTDNPEFSEEVGQRLISEFNCPVKRRFIGPVIGAHTGCGALGVVFFGKLRLTDK